MTAFGRKAQAPRLHGRPTRCSGGRNGSRTRKIALGSVGTVVSSTVAPSRLLTTQIAVGGVQGGGTLVRC
jgi:hypothetical protein